ncbi:hypothetical protein [Salinarimonas soli]|uniref:Uncharacterized protein n=1 Tax=Salinarimonas soli TaxID=1638099 RepID=A0A5B2VCJ1_9HYPH|nr:hypothetical protein [Salinarimonas soli]KAA2236029.1 hypothetical protein F0L46_16780 [Salinarimonas soli]
MPTPSPALAVLLERGILYRCPDRDGLDAALRAGPAAVAVRLDRPDLGLGSLPGLMALRWMQQAGHRPVVLLRPGADAGERSGPAREARWAARLSRCLRTGEGPGDAAVIDTGRWRDGLRERAAWSGPDAALAEALDVIEVGRRFGPVVRVGALDEADALEAGGIQAARLGAGPVASFTAVLAGDSRLRVADGTSRALSLGREPGPWAQALADDVPRLLRLLTDLPLSRIQAWARGAEGGLDAARQALGDSAARLFGEGGLVEEPALREVA